MYRVANEFKTRIDEWFKWRDVFIVGLEYCSTNILKISLRAVNVEVVSPNGKKWIASELLEPSTTMNSTSSTLSLKKKVDEIEVTKKQVKNLTCIFYSLSDTLNLISSDVSDSKFSTLGLIQTASSFFAFLERNDLDFLRSSSRT